MELYVLDLTPLAGRIEEALRRLSPERREKALRLRGGARLRSVGGGLLLRCFVGEGPFVFGAAGKPSTPGGPCFSLSHSGDLAVLAVDTAPVGADTERIAPVRAAVLPRVLSEDERSWMAADPERRFAWLWTRKEAVLKWSGDGVTRPMRAVAVLPGAVSAVDGAACCVHTEEYRDYMISAASAGEARFTPVEVPLADLLEGE